MILRLIIFSLFENNLPKNGHLRAVHLRLYLHSFKVLNHLPHSHTAHRTMSSTAVLGTLTALPKELYALITQYFGFLERPRLRMTCHLLYLVTPPPTHAELLEPKLRLAYHHVLAALLTPNIKVHPAVLVPQHVPKPSC